ncbi:MAG TPA: hypothetical protein VMT52_10710, partial [Planctomycetota bacterium]|nr:hypothetical protein [Planctomycetota bacterium]
MVHHSAGNNAAGAVDALQYDPVRGWGFEVLNPGAAGRGEFERFGPFDDTPNSRARFGNDCPEELYDSFVGFKDHPTLCNLTVSGNETDPCTADHFSCPR